MRLQEHPAGLPIDADRGLARIGAQSVRRSVVRVARDRTDLGICASWSHQQRGNGAGDRQAADEKMAHSRPNKPDCALVLLSRHMASEEADLEERSARRLSGCMPWRPRMRISGARLPTELAGSTPAPGGPATQFGNSLAAESRGLFVTSLNQRPRREPMGGVARSFSMSCGLAADRSGDGGFRWAY